MELSSKFGQAPARSEIVHDLDLPPSNGMDDKMTTVERSAGVYGGLEPLQDIPSPNVNMPLDEMRAYRRQVALRLLYLFKQDRDKYSNDGAAEEVIEQVMSETGWQRLDVETAINYAERISKLSYNGLKYSVSFD
jgi:hypothetical protein